MPAWAASPAVHDVYRDTLVESGYLPERFRVCMNRQIYVCEDPEEGWREVGEHYLYSFNRYREWFAAAGDFSELGAPLASSDELPRDVHLAGTPEMVIKGIQQIQKTYRFERLIFFANPPGLPIERGSQSLELLPQEVMPHFADTPSG